MFKQVILFAAAHTVLLMLAMFLVIAVFTYWPGRRARIESHGAIPLRDDC